MKRRLFLYAALIGLAIAAHARTLYAGFVWDDRALILRDPLIRSWRLIPEGFRHFLFTDATASNFYRPLQRLSYTLEYCSFAFWSTPYHATNILLHATAAVALVAFGTAFLRLYKVAHPEAIAFCAAAIWALHPAHSAVVDYVAGRADSLAAVFGFLAMYLGVCSLRGDRRVVWPLHVLAGVAILASILSKESGFVFGAAYVLLVALRGNWRAAVPCIVVVALVAMGYLTLRSEAQKLALPQLTPPAPELVRPIIVARAFAEYAGVLVAPVNLHMERDVETHPWGYSDASLTSTAWHELQTVAGVALLGVFLIWLLRARRRAPAVFALLLFASISYVPVSGLLALNATVAEHWVYVPFAFLALAVVTEAAPLMGRAHLRLAIGTLATVWVAFLTVRTYVRAGDWSDQRTFLQRTIDSGGDSARMLINLAGVESSDGNLDRAEMLLQKALGKQQEQPFALLNLAVLAFKKNDLARARELLRRAERVQIVASQARELLAAIEYRESGRVNLSGLAPASFDQPQNWPATRRYVRALDEAGQTNTAVIELTKLLKTEWYRAESWQLLSAYLRKLGHGDEAAAASDWAHKLDVHLSCAKIQLTKRSALT